MNRRGFLGLLAGAAVAPIAKVLPAAPPAALELASFNELLKSYYTADVVRSLTVPEWVVPVAFLHPNDYAQMHEALNEIERKSADGEGIRTESCREREEASAGAAAGAEAEAGGVEG